MRGFLEALHDRVRQNKTWFNVAYHHFFFCHPFWIIGCCNNLVAQASQASFLLVEACFKQLPVNWQFFLAFSFSVFSVFQSRSLCWDPKRQNFSFFQRQWLLFRWIFWVCILGFSIALISNVARILIHKWTVEAAWQLKIPAGFWALASPSCFEICFDLALSILFVHVSKVHDLDSLNDPLIEHVLLDTGSRPWKRPYATFTPRTRHDVTSDWWWMARLMSHELPSPLHFCWPCWVTELSNFSLCATKLHWIAQLLVCLARLQCLPLVNSFELGICKPTKPRQKWNKQQAWEKCCWNMVATITLSHCNCCLGFSVGGPEVTIIEDHKKTILAWLWLDAQMLRWVFSWHLLPPSRDFHKASGFLYLGSFWFVMPHVS